MALDTWNAHEPGKHMDLMSIVIVVLGLLFAMMLGAASLVTGGLRSRVSALERELDSLRHQIDDLPHRAAVPVPVPVIERPAAPITLRVDQLVAPTPRAQDAGPAPRKPEVRQETVEVDEQSVAVTSSLAASVRAWFLGGNTIVRLAMLILFIGVSFLARYAAELGWFPLEVRLATAALGGAVCSGIGWRLRERRRGYGLTMQGGGVAIIFMVVFAAFRLYGLIPAGFAFATLAVLAALTAFLASAQNALPLATLGLTGAFLAPILTSTSQGNHVALFSYYAVINVAVAWLATRKPWKLLNTLGFLFTFGVALLWGMNRWTPAHLATTEPFLLLHVALYLFITVQYARQIVAKGSGAMAAVDAGLLLGVPMAAFGLQMVMLRHVEYGIALSAAGFAAVYLLLARWLWQRLGTQLRLLTEGMLAMGVVFLSLVAPYALDGSWIAVAWAVQGAGMVWMALRQRRTAALVLGLVLQGLAGFALWRDGSASPELIGSLVVGLAAMLSAWMLAQHTAFAEPLVASAWPAFRAATLALGLWALITGPWAEIARSALSANLRVQVSLGWVLVLAVVFELLRQRLKWLVLKPLARVMVLITTGLWAAWLGVQALDHGGTALWAIYVRGGLVSSFAIAAASWWLMRNTRITEGASLSRTEPMVWGAHLLLQAAALSYALGSSFIARHGSWTAALVIAAPLALMAWMIEQQKKGRWPFVMHAASWHQVLAWPLLGLGLLWVLGVNLWSDAGMHPLPYLPMLNPIDLTHLWMLIFTLRLPHEPARPRFIDKAVLQGVLGAAGFWWLTSLLVRTLHHWAGAPIWMDGALGSGTIQTGLSVLWTCMAMAAMFFATRQGHRALWTAGAVLLGAVVVKLVFVDLSHTGTVLRIVSFIGVGALMLVIGYLAPLPPQRAVQVLKHEEAA
jgi:uncharacterized membrane protein